MRRTKYYCSVLLPSTDLGLEVAVLVYSPRTNFHHETIKRRASWTTLREYKHREMHGQRFLIRTFNQKMMRSLSAVLRAFTMKK